MTAPAELAATAALFVPGSRADRFDKALASGADVVILDLEDAVRPEDRVAARAAISAFLQSARRERVWVRISAAGTADHDLDVELLQVLADGGIAPAAVVLAKAERVEDVEAVKAISTVEVVALIESARGYAAARDLATAVAPSGRLALGALDLALDLGTSAHLVIDLVAFEMVVASRLAGLLPPLASPDTAIDDVAGVHDRARRTSMFGFGGSLCIHPRQVEAVRTAYRPSEEEISWANRMIAAGHGAVQIDGQMIDAPVVARARKILARASVGDAAVS